MAQAKSMEETVGKADVDAYMARLPKEARETLEPLRRSIRAAVPEAAEVISYGVPTYRLDKALVSFGAAKSHCSFYIMSTAVTDAYRGELKGYKLGKGSVSFPFGGCIPDDLVKKLVQARIEENSK